MKFVRKNVCGAVSLESNGRCLLADRVVLGLILALMVMSEGGHACFNTAPTFDAITNNLKFRPTTTTTALTGATTTSGSSTTTESSTTTSTAPSTASSTESSTVSSTESSTSSSTESSTSTSTSASTSTSTSTSTISTGTLSPDNMGCYDPATTDNQFGSVNLFACISISLQCTSISATAIQYPIGTTYPDAPTCNANNKPTSFVRCQTTTSPPLVVCRPAELACEESQITGNNYSSTIACLLAADLEVPTPAYCNCIGSCTQYMGLATCCLPPATQNGGDGHFFASNTCN